ncbi:peptidylprolyl isomerase [Gimesia chilikensis]|jgi:foldase protein PrsA|uniref:peptidylprolyl isomerase n=1 Tax=Gimesia chilikensis TaxID=2605989 RepID=A0A517W5Q1_9PLAN|nr:peptidylprolyl isomerase [Gimesia chilikensis]MBN73896.1 peptidylprolyl isomerase [Gimesia sp.]MCR9232772.1 peptidylprolyl isomerase [bacterium]KAA0133319.1 peptidylprolyl isomerase [Gimesia chilikensis]QDT82633.1 peptidylprolyl isomerase [Gimesia chilikensis]QDU00576.1 peptidylprolyl isomerase [Gimesia chilikensis]
MGEPTPNPHATQTKTKSKRKIIFFAAGTGLVLLAGVLFFQTFNAKTGSAGEDKSAGKVRLSGNQPAVRSQPVAKVGSVVITEDELARECIALYGPEVLENVINRAVIEQACQKAGVTVEQAEVHAEVEKIAKRFNLDTKTWYDMLQAERKMNPSQYRRNVIWPMLALRKLAGQQTHLTQAEVQKAFVRDYGPRVKARMIMMDNLHRAQKVWDDVKRNPADFERKARDFSIEPNSRALGGAIQPIPQYSDNESLWKAAFKLKEGEISGIIQIGPSRYAILMCEGHTDPVVTNIEEVKSQLIEQLTEEQTQEAVARVFAKLKEETRVDNYITNTVTGGVSQTSGTNFGQSPVQQAIPSPTQGLNRPTR